MKGVFIMSTKRLHFYAFTIFLIFFVLGVAKNIGASTLSDDGKITNYHLIDVKAEYPESAKNYLDEYPDLLKWDIEVDNKVFKVYVNTYEEKIIIRGQADDWKQKEKVEKFVNLRAPSNYRIIYEISMNDYADKGSKNNQKFSL